MEGYMQIVSWNDFLEKPAPSALTIGVFDGMHLGHLALIQKVVSLNNKPTVITFRKNPKKLLFHDDFEGEVYSLRQKLDIFRKQGIQRVVLIDFSENWSKMKGREFLDLLEKPGMMASLVIGSNFRCGYKQDTGADCIKEINAAKGIATEILPNLSLSGELISSSRLRTLIISGDLEKASVMMGRNAELDLTDIESNFVPAPIKGAGNFCYSLDHADRVLPPGGFYRVLLHRETGKKAFGEEDGDEESPIEERAYIENKKLYLPYKAESIEYIGV